MPRTRPAADRPTPAGALAAAPGQERIAELQTRLLRWYAANGRDLPWRRTRDPYAVLVSETMLQQTQVPRVVVKYEEFLRAFPTLEGLAGSPLAEVLRVWRGLGYNNRAVRLRRCAAICVEGAAAGASAALPTTREALSALPGVGPYTARAVLVFAHNADLAAVDANVRRVLTHELGLAEDLSPAALQAMADAVLPRGRSRDWHNALMDYGSLVLTARVTGIAPRTRQGRFEGSRRWYRSRLLRTLLDDGPQDVASLARRLALDEATTAELCLALERDGLVRRSDGLVAPA
jgi:A/G-specific adenine glycosylase